MTRFSNFIIVELTLDCNLKCSYCYLCYDKFESKEKMSFETFKKIVDKAAYLKKINEDNDSFQIVFHGGEPTLIGHEMLYKMVKYFKDVFNANGLISYANIQTNGTTLNEDFLPALRLFDSIGISYDGEGVASDLRTTNNTTKEKIERSIKLLKDNNLNFGMVSVVSKNNYDDVNEMLNSSHSRIKVVPIYDTRNKESEIELSAKEIFDLFVKKDLDNKFYINNNGTYMTLSRIFLRVIIDILFEHGDNCQSTCGFKFCGSGIKILAFQPNGMVHTCDRWTMTDPEVTKTLEIGHIDSYDFLGILQLKRGMEWNKKLHNVNKDTGCDTCFARYACTSDCQSLHYSKFGEFGIDKNRVCYEIKNLYYYVEENLHNIIKTLADTGKKLHFVEDEIFEIKLRKQYFISELGYKLDIDEKKKFDYYIGFSKIGDINASI